VLRRAVHDDETPRQLLRYIERTTIATAQISLRIPCTSRPSLGMNVICECPSCSNVSIVRVKFKLRLINNSSRVKVFRIIMNDARNNNIVSTIVGLVFSISRFGQEVFLFYEQISSWLRMPSARDTGKIIIFNYLCVYRHDVWIRRVLFRKIQSNIHLVKYIISRFDFRPAH